MSRSEYSLLKVSLWQDTLCSAMVRADAAGRFQDVATMGMIYRRLSTIRCYLEMRLAR